MRKKPIRVFEHQKLLINEATGFQKKHWTALSRYNEKYQNRYFTLLHNGVKFSQYVGVIQAGDLTIEVLPKIDKVHLDSTLEKSIWHNVLLKMLQECSLLRIEHVEKAHLRLKSQSILDIYIEIFLNEVEKLLHKGLIKKYQRYTGNISTLKGKIDFPKHLSLNLAHKERFFVQHTVYDRKHLLNQILYTALQIIPSLVTHPSFLDKFERIMLDFPEMDSLKVAEEDFTAIIFNRKNSHYREAISIARMLLLKYRPDVTGGSNNVIAILFDMNKLWEEYVFRQVRKAAKDGTIVKRQQSQKFWISTSSSWPKTIRPDIVIIRGCKTTILDTKWKILPHLTPDDDDLKQMFVYNLYWNCDHSILLYPAPSYLKSTGVYFNFAHTVPLDHRCSVATCNILDEEGKLDKGMGDKILQLLGH